METYADEEKEKLKSPLHENISLDVTNCSFTASVLFLIDQCALDFFH